jgi:hypothetical protein
VTAPFKEAGAAQNRDELSLTRNTNARFTDMPDPEQLLHMNLHEVFSERDADKRQAAIERTYAEDVKFIDPDGEVVGWRALNDRAAKILDDAPADFVLEEDGLEYLAADAAALPWRFGPPGKPVVRGIDILTVRDGRVVAIRTLIGSPAGA